MLFTKMQGLGNDFIIIEDFDDKYNDYGRMAVKLCHRNFGVGADGILVIKKSDISDAKMLIYNSDGSQAEMCGNGIRCFGKYLFHTGYVNHKRVTIETLDGVKEVEIQGDGDFVRVNMGSPSFNHDSIPVSIKKDMIIDEPVEIDGEKFNITSMLMGVPHTIIFVDVMDESMFRRVGPMIEKSRYFPRRTNVNFVSVLNDGEFKVQTWERGAGLTLACGTGTCASLVACVLNKKTEKKAVAHLSAGDMIIEWSNGGEVYMSGPAEIVFTGEYKEDIDI